MAQLLNLSKGETVTLTKSNGAALVNARVNITWRDTGSDIDVSAVLLGPNEKLAYGMDLIKSVDGVQMKHPDTREASKWAYKSIVYYQNLRGIDVGGIEHSGDVLGGGDHDGETITIQLNNLPSAVNSIALVVTSHSDTGQTNTFGNANPTATVVDADTNEELYRFELAYEASNFTSVDLGDLRRRGNGWEFVATGSGIGTSAQGLSDVIQKYM